MLGRIYPLIVWNLYYLGDKFSAIWVYHKYICFLWNEIQAELAQSERTVDLGGKGCDKMVMTLYSFVLF